MRSPGKELREFITEQRTFNEEQRKFNKDLRAELRASFAVVHMVLSCLVSAPGLAFFCVWKAGLTHGGEPTWANVLKGVGKNEMLLGMCAASVLFVLFGAMSSSMRGVFELMGRVWGEKGEGKRAAEGSKPSSGQ